MLCLISTIIYVVLSFKVARFANVHYKYVYIYMYNNILYIYNIYQILKYQRKLTIILQPAYHISCFLAFLLSP